MNKEKICLIGYGYWGKIIHKNLTNLGYKQITIVDKVLDNLNEINENFDYYFVVTPFTTHKKVLNQLSKYRNKKIWCEKPLAESVKDIDIIYKKLESKNNKLFVDWVYTHNTAIDFIKESLKDSRSDEFSLNDSLSIPLKEARENFEKEYLLNQVKKFGGNISKTAKFIGMERSALHRKLKLLGVKDLN